ncbi:hypothetical protein NUW54_g3341 [Trametes sanguinea]|uniref:Uncharacterized protein n=1 Tax=Trametes sanguinea TaxID=158606 RepID=A0ACC1Q2X1_9APHY|nr:hypothetical protein NUW54_g3341 [Trametes sanguinea]
MSIPHWQAEGPLLSTTGNRIHSSRRVLTGTTTTMSAEIPTTMRAAVYRPGHFNLSVEDDFPVPEPMSGQVLLKVVACGACHTDIALLTNAIIDDRTYILGHEIAGYPAKCASFTSAHP